MKLVVIYKQYNLYGCTMMIRKDLKKSMNIVNT